MHEYSLSCAHDNVADAPFCSVKVRGRVRVGAGGCGRGQGVTGARHLVRQGRRGFLNCAFGLTLLYYILPLHVLMLLGELHVILTKQLRGSCLNTGRQPRRWTRKAAGP
jgi:hypothetical protein